MQSRAVPLLALALAALLAHAPRPASAAGAVVGPPGGAPVIAGARTAVALGDGRTTAWSQLDVSAVDGGFVWLLPVAPGALVDLASDAWLDALDDATAPTLVSSPSTFACASGQLAVSVSRAATPPSLAPVASGVAGGVAALSALLAAAGVDVDAAQAFVPVFDAGLDVLVLDFASSSSSATTRTVRVVQPGALPVELPMAGGSAAYVDTTLFVVGSAPAAIGGGTLTLDPGAIAWGPDVAAAYGSTVDALVDSGGGAAWLLQSAMPARLFSSLPVVGAVSLPPVVERYFALASGGGSADAGGCWGPASAVADASAPLAPLCPAGAVATVPGSTPCGAVPAGDVSPGLLVCDGSLTDAALALAGLDPASTWLTRAAGVLLAGSGEEVPVSTSAGPSLSPVVVTSGIAPGCSASVDAGTPSSLGAVPTATPVTSGTSGPAPSGPGPVAPTSRSHATSTLSPAEGQAAADVATDAAQAASGGCDGRSGGEPDEGGDSSSDSSGCDSSSSSSDDASGGCSGSSSDDSSSDCSVTRRGRRGRGVGVRLLIAGASVCAVLRRATRRRARATR